MPLPKPTAKSLWGVGNPDFANRVVEPSAPKKEAAWLDDERPPAPIANWLWWIHHQWIEYLESVTDELAATFDEVVADSGGNYTTLQAAIDAVAAPARIFVRSSAAIGTTIEMNKTGLEVWFHPRATYSDGGAGTGLNITGVRCILRGARLTDFTNGVNLTGASKNSRVMDCNFANVTNDIVDAGLNTSLTNNLNEVP